MSIVTARSPARRLHSSLHVIPDVPQVDFYTSFVHVGSNPSMEQAAVHAKGYASSLTPLCSVMFIPVVVSLCCLTHHAVHTLLMRFLDRGAFPSHAKDGNWGAFCHCKPYCRPLGTLGSTRKWHKSTHTSLLPTNRCESMQQQPEMPS